jgi:hypothetical protein
VAAGLATGSIIGGLVAALRYYDGPYPYYGGYYPAGYVGPIGYGAPGWEAIACRAIARSIRSAAPIGVAMAGGTVAGSPPLLSWRVPAEMKCGSPRYGILGVERRSPR